MIRFSDLATRSGATHLVLMTPHEARQAITELVRGLDCDRRPDFAWVAEHAPDGDIHGSVARLWEAAGRCLERCDLARAMRPLTESELYNEALAQFCDEEYTWAYDGVLLLIEDLSRYGAPTAEWTERFSPDTAKHGLVAAQHALDALWVTFRWPSLLRKLLVLIDPERAARHSPDWQSNYSMSEEDSRELLRLYHRADPPTLPSYVPRKICSRCDGEGAVQGDCGTPCWDCGGKCSRCDGKGAVERWPT